MVEIIGFSGKMGTGKNFIAENICLKYLPYKPTLIMAFADQIKLDVIVRDKCNYNAIYGEKDDLTRILLQKRGTEEGRQKYGENIWIDYVDNWIKVYSERGIKRFMITDVRFPNEVDWIKLKGGKIFRVNAVTRNNNRLNYESKGNKEKYNLIKNHISETALDNYIFDNIINNDYDDDMKIIIENILKIT
jgi:hypothetical protein